MWKYCISYCLMLFGTLLTAQTTLNLTIEDMPEGKSFLVMLKTFEGSEFKLLDTVRVMEKGVVTFDVSNNQPTAIMELSIPKSVNKAEFIYNKAEKLELTASFLGLKNGDLQIRNSKENRAYAQLLSLVSQFTKLVDELNLKKEQLTVFQPDYRKQWGTIENAVEALQKELNEKLKIIATNNSGTYTSDVLVPLTKIPLRNQQQRQQFDGYMAFLHQHFWDFVDFNDERMLNHYAFIDKIYMYLGNYAPKTEDGTKAALDQILNRLQDNEEVNSLVYNSLLKTFIKLNNEIFTMHIAQHEKAGCSISLDFKELKRLQAMKAIAIGGLAPDILLYDDKKKPKSLKETMSKNKLTIVYMWLSWCQHCQKTTPQLDALYKKYKKKGLGVFAVSLDEKETDWKMALNQYQTSWINVAELVPIKQSKVAPSYNISTTPALFVLDGEGKVLARNLFGDKLESFLQSKLK